MAASTSHTVSIKQLIFEHHPDGFGINSATPRLSWSFETAEGVKDWAQTSCDVEILHHGHSEPEIYKRKGAQSVLVPWPGSPMKSRERAKVRVRAHGEHAPADGSRSSRATEWSAWKSLETALLDQKNDWTAKPIWSGRDSADDSPLRPVRFRRQFDLPSDKGYVSHARLYITSYGVYEAFVNGKRASDHHMAPGWTSYNHRLNYQVLNVTDLLKSGDENVIAAEVAEGWYAGRLSFGGGRRHIWGDKVALLAQLEVYFADDERGPFVLNTGGDWKSHESALTQSEIYDGETYDVTQEVAGWRNETSFDQSEWSTVKVLDSPSTTLVAPEAPPVRVIEQVKPVKFFNSESGKTVIDFGQNLVGNLHIRSIRGSKGDTLVFTFAEVMEQGEVGTRPLRHAKCTDTIILGDDELIDWSPKFTFHGFRYVQIEGYSLDDGKKPFKQEDVVAQVWHTDMRRTGTFDCSHPMINQLHQNSVWSMRGNFLSIPTDCPQRDERLGWTGDIAVFGPTANFMYDTRGTLGSWMVDVKDEQLEPECKSVPPLVVPCTLTGAFARPPQAIWADVTILLPWELYRSSNDIEVLRRQYASMKSWLEEGIPRGADGLWNSNAWQLGDWLDPAAPSDDPAGGRTDGTYVADAYLVNSTKLFWNISTIIGENTEAEKYEKEYRKVLKLFQDKYITPAGRTVCDTQTGLALAINFDLFRTAEEKVVAAERLAFLVRRSKFRIATGFAGTPNILPALSKISEHQLAYRMLQEKNCPSWMYPITMGATTIWERWDSMLPDGSINPGEMTSFNHYALGSVSAWLHSNVGGISPIGAGWQSFQVAPMPGGTITSADISYDGPYGLISCNWKLSEDAEFEMTVTVPPNSKALVTLPPERRDGRSGEAGEGDQWVGSGIHRFSCKFSAEAWPPVVEMPAFFKAEPDNIA